MPTLSNIKPRTKIIITLLILSPVLGELLSGSSPPLEFFSPLSFVILLVLYGGGTLLIREARARWKLQWSIIFLGIAYGILEEGIMMQSFFSINHVDLGAMSGYGMLGGVQWPWTIALLVYHATISTLIPIAIVETLWPDYTYTPLVGKKGLAVVGTSLGIVTVFVMIFIWSIQGQYSSPYVPSPVLLFGSLGVILLCVWLGYRFRETRILTHHGLIRSPIVFALAGFLMQVFILMVGGFASNNVDASVTVAIQLGCIGLFLVFAVRQLLHVNRSARHVLGFVSGCLVFYIFLTLIHEVFNKALGMSLVGVGAIVGLLYWRRAILRKNPAAAESLS